MPISPAAKINTGRLEGTAAAPWWRPSVGEVMCMRFRHGPMVTMQQAVAQSFGDARIVVARVAPGRF
jgi:hypothetical protein